MTSRRIPRLIATQCFQIETNQTESLQPFSVCRPLSTWWARRRPPVFASLFLTRRFGLICISHVIRLDAKQSAKGCATCTWLEGATTCGVIQCYPMASGSTTHGPPLPAYPSPRPRKIAIILCVCLCVCRYSIVTIK